MFCGTNGAVAAMDRAYMSLRARKPSVKKTSEQSSPFRRWTTSSGGSSYRHHDHRSMYNKQMSEGSPVVPGASSGSSVARWSLGLDQLLADPAGAAAFAEFLHKQYAAENIRFWLSCEEYKSLPADARSAKAADIWKRHLGERASDPVNVDAAARYAAAHRMCHDPPPIDLFDQAQTHIFDVMKLDAYPRFLRSAEHGACARAELRGEPLACRLGNDRGDHDTDTTTKLKKSVSNASDRRRSGGASLLPWRFRPASRERNNDSTQQPPKPGLCGGQCRVVFPDGSTSVVRAEGAVGTLVERLLQRRQLPHDHYDVLLKDPKQGESATVDLQTPASTLSGREIVVERRAMVRLELNSVGNGGAARCVVVRCGGARPLAHVLRRVGARYGLPPARAVLRGRALHPGTMMQELDGCVLQVVETADEATARTESDGDSLSDLALRLQDDQDNESQSTISGSSACSRVRAALHPGPDKHLPPNFLNDLRQRIQKDTNPVRSPPPLPPKPAPRGPSRV